MAVDAKPLKISKKKAQDAKSFTSQDKAKRKSTLKERQEKKYPFPDSDVASMLDELLKSKVIELPEMKRPDESDKVLKAQKKAHQLISKPKQTLIQRKKTPSEFHSASKQYVKRPITLNDFMPSQLKGEELIFMTCNQIDEEYEDE
ncbi:hypothetical protein CCACVL1_25700 [Corchorus capsularis]|uniref:Uncharacterized protein n=1 Tax=Corchorus capsularis TaxID=210143 RepID=A0A1R3GI33_COCAP|nr:hypothetical protein CCACVL1_25700 [Corchorus capsularis]